jgi:hypothetical protein
LKKAMVASGAVTRIMVCKNWVMVGAPKFRL